MNLKETRAAALKAANDIVVKAQAEGRDLRDGEQAAIEAKFAEIEALDVKIAAAAKSQELIDRLAGSGRGHRPPGVPEAPRDGNPPIALFGRSGKAAAAQIVNQMRDAGGQKAIVAGTNIVFQPTAAMVGTDILAARHLPMSFLELLPATPRDVPQWSYMRQTARNNMAAIVPAGGLKPTSIYTIAPEQGKVHVFAHMSEPVDSYLLEDVEPLTAFLRTEMLYGLAVEIEDEVIHGSGVGDHLEGLMATSGVQTQTPAVDPITTLRSAATKLELQGFTPAAFILNASDWELVETTRNTSGAFDLGGPVDRAARTVWGVQVVLSTRLAVGEAVALDTSALTLDYDETGVRFQAGYVNEDFSHNRVRFRAEGRFGLSTSQPAGIVIVDLGTGD